MRISEELQMILNDKKVWNIIGKLYSKEKLSVEDSSFILGCAIILLQEYNKNNDELYFEAAYDIVLRYSVSSGDYSPLYDVSCNYGFYPTVRFINSKNLEKKSIINAINDFKLEYYKNGNYIETYEQHTARSGVIQSVLPNVCFIAPTSSGKSSVIIQHLQMHQYIEKAIIIVPSKSLVAQTYSELRKADLNCKIICHEGMYNQEERFVGALTQERTLRLLERNSQMKIDCIYVDEAHNIFSNDPRNILLSRAIKICKIRNHDLKVIYLSPFVEDARHLLQDEGVEIDEKRICFNIKEPTISEYRKDGEIYVYYRFCNEFFHIGNDVADPFVYMFKHIKRKNFCYLTSPKNIELFARVLYEKTPNISMTEELQDLINVLSEHVHPALYMNEYLKHGIVYLHAKLPEQIKEYLEHQFRVNPSIKYLIANSVVLEGVNMPIDCMFIWDVNYMTNARLQNLIGRVNRLNNVFDTRNNGLEGLLPEIHFINSDFYYKNKRRMTKTIERLYDDITDEITNPLLQSYSPEKITKNRNKIVTTNANIIDDENAFFSDASTDIERLKKSLISSGMNQLINLTDDNLSIISNELKKIDLSKSVVEIVSDVFTKNNIAKDFEFSRLKNPKAINYYKQFIKASHKGNLASLVNSEFNYHRKREKEGEVLMYVGDKFGEVSGFREGKGKNVYIDLNKKSDLELINLLIVKVKIEQDFLGFQYSRAVNYLHDNKYITDDQYNMEIYGTTDNKKIQMQNMGVPIGLLSLLENYDQLKNIYIDENGNARGNIYLKEFMKAQNPFTQYELSKHILF